MRIATRDLAWLESVTAAACADCGAAPPILKLPDGTTSPGAAVDFVGRRLFCATGACAGARHATARAARQAALAARPRCAVPGCRRADTWRVAGVGLCGRHKTRVLRRHAGLGILGFLGTAEGVDRATVLAWAQEG